MMTIDPGSLRIFLKVIVTMDSQVLEDGTMLVAKIKDLIIFWETFEWEHRRWTS